MTAQQVIISTSAGNSTSSESMFIATNDLVVELFKLIDPAAVARLTDIYRHDGVEAELLSTIIHEIFSIEVGQPIRSLQFMSKYKNVSTPLTKELLDEVLYFFKKRFIINQLQLVPTQQLTMVGGADNGHNQLLEISIFSHLRGREICTSAEFVDAFTYHKLMSDISDGTFNESQWPAALGLLNKYSQYRHRLVSILTSDDVNNMFFGVSTNGRI